MTQKHAFFSRNVRVGKYKTHYVEYGDGDPIVLIHGGGPGASGEFNWRQAIPALAQHGRVIAVDMLGYGGTDKPTDVEYSHKTLVNHVSAFIDVLCLDKMYLGGNSLGAYVAARFSVDDPDRVKKLLLVSSGTIAHAMGLDPDKIVGVKALAGFDGTKQSLREIFKVLMHHPENITEELLEARFQTALQSGVAEAQRSFLNYMRTRLRNEPAQAQWFDLSHRLPRLGIPMKFVWGEHDVFAAPSFVQELRVLLPDADFEVFDDSGHVAQNDEPARFNKTAIDFFFGT